MDRRASSKFNYSISVLPNGISVVTQKLPWLDHVAFQVVVKAGKAAERKGEYGLSHFSEHVIPEKLIQLNPPRKLSTALSDLGFTGFNISTGHDLVYCPCGVNSSPCTFSRETFEPALGICLNIVGQSPFPEHEVEGERKRILEEIDTDLQNAQLKREFLWHSRFLPGSHWVRKITGTKEDVGAASAKSVKRFWERNYTGSNIFVFAAGNTDHDAIVKLTLSSLGHLPFGVPNVFPPLTPSVAETRFPFGLTIGSKAARYAIATAAQALCRFIPSLAEVIPPLSEQLYMRLVWPGAIQNDPQDILPVEKQNNTLRRAMSVLNDMIKQSLVTGIKETYSVSASTMSAFDFGMLIVDGSFNWRKQGTVLSAIRRCIRELSEKPPENLLDFHRKRAANYWKVHEPSSTGQIVRMRSEYTTFGRLISDEEYLDVEMRVTAADVKTAAGLLLEKPLSLFVSGPETRFPSREEIDRFIRSGKDHHLKTP